MKKITLIGIRDMKVILTLGLTLFSLLFSAEAYSASCNVTCHIKYEDILKIADNLTQEDCKYLGGGDYVNSGCGIRRQHRGRYCVVEAREYSTGFGYGDYPSAAKQAARKDCASKLPELQRDCSSIYDVGGIYYDQPDCD